MKPSKRDDRADGAERERCGCRSRRSIVGGGALDLGGGCIWLAMRALPDHVVEAELSASRYWRTESGVRKMSVGRMASWASCAFLALVE